MNTIKTVRFVLKPIVFLFCLVPLAMVFTDAYGITGSLGANPIENIQDRFGQWGLRFIMLALAITPLRQLSGYNWLARFRRPLGLFAFFYVLMHFVVWLVLDSELLMSAIIEDVFERPFITIGMVALVLLLAMAATSTLAMRRRLGSTWQKIHNSIYVVALLGVWHFWWQVKNDISEPLIYAVIAAVLLGYRIWRNKLQVTPVRA
ncbi:MAG: sulfoxide reductase heme-binding subunit YedZ [Gammaproteobacteria bacterium]|nr:sulfoxide reductase heme-binding subunit YedZ [Gammaproteobacteria bacterium]